MSKIDKSYHDLLNEILQKGYWYDDPKRKDVKRLEIGSYTFKHDFKDGFPILTTKKINYNNIVTELLWFLKGDTNIKYLLDNNCNIWNKDAYNYYIELCVKENWIPYLDYSKWLEEVKKTPNWYESGIKHRNAGGQLGPIYGHQWRNFNDVDQISNLITNLKEQPLATDHIVNSWNASDLNKMALPPCHYGFQIIVRPLTWNEQIDLYCKKFNNNSLKQIILNDQGIRDINKKLEKVEKLGFELHWQQRSVDTFLGLPYNISSYATLALIIEKLTGYKALGIQGDLKKVHLYDNSINAVEEQLSRDINKYNDVKIDYSDNFKNLNNCFTWDDITLNEFINSLEPKDIFLKDYESYSHLKVEMLERQ